jgi:hypothetical protein
MLSQVTLWAERVGMVLDAILVLRIAQLKLSRTYIFILLFALLSLFYDGIEVWMGRDSIQFARVGIYSRFVYAIVFPLAAWDLFEEAKPMIDKIRRLAMTRLISSLLFITLWGLLIAAFTGEDGDSSQYMLRLALVVWTGSVAATLAFLWVMRKGIKAGPLPLPHNTKIWLRFFQVLLIIEAASCVLLLLQGIGTKVFEAVEQISDPFFIVSGILVTGWCAIKLRSISSDASDVQADVGN